ncbi:helix-turn-helix domain-containing protein [Streptococcus agalactiae]|uniref:helix-turn-helix domain-containing protein n=1 Tax=Streptococcus agalactiae TaxID=1311 RepID=UPI00362A02AA|nr:helix-turn-helix transcriptional regulator [Streptococcus agalactiae]
MSRLKELRKEKKLSQNKLIEEIAKPPYNLKISRRTLQYWESGKRDIKSDKAQALADYFEVPIAYLLGFSNVRNKEMIVISREEYESLVNFKKTILKMSNK